MFSTFVACVCIAIGIWGRGNPLLRARHGIPLGWQGPAFYELTAWWDGFDLRLVYHASMYVISGYIPYMPDRSISLWPVFVVSLLLPIIWLQRRRRVVGRGFAVLPVDRSA